MTRTLAIAAALLVLSGAASAQEPAAPQPAAPQPAAPQPEAAQETKVPLRQRLYTWGAVGTTFAYGQTYGNLNLGLGLRWKGGLTPNVEASYMFGASPTIWALRPGITWYTSLPVLRPYVGAYLTHWFVSNRPDENGVGGRLGISLGRVLSLGVTYDRALNCSHDCDMWTPQVSAGLSV